MEEKPEAQKKSESKFLNIVGKILVFLVCYIPVGFIGYVAFLDNKIAGILVWVIGGVVIYADRESLSKNKEDNDCWPAP